MLQLPKNGQSRVLISNVQPVVNNGASSIKRVKGEFLQLFVSLLADYELPLNAQCNYRLHGSKAWQSTTFTHIQNNRFQAGFTPYEIGLYEYQIEGWVDYPTHWLNSVKKAFHTKQNVLETLSQGLPHLEFLQKKLKGKKKQQCKNLLESIKKLQPAAAKAALQPWLKETFLQNPNRQFSTKSPWYKLQVQPKLAKYSSWFQLFIHNTETNEKGTFKTVESKLQYIKNWGFTILALPSIHPIQTEKQKTNTTTKLGTSDGLQKQINPEYGSLGDYKKLLKTAKSKYNITVAFEVALSFSKQNPLVQEHPNWFEINTVTNRYQPHWETDEWQKLWTTFYDLLKFWIKAGVTLFNVPNAQQISFRFWTWLITSIQEEHPEVLFFASGISQDNALLHLAKAGFSGGQTLYPWRNFRHELNSHVNYFLSNEPKECLQPSFWPNTPEVLPYALQTKNEAVFLTRLFMAATLSSNYGVYGNAYAEMCSEAEPGKERYALPEKNNILDWNWEKRNKIKWLMQELNKARAEHAALQQTKNYKMLALENDKLFAYYKWSEGSQVLMVVNLDAYNRQEGWVQLPLETMNSRQTPDLQMNDLISGAQYNWKEEWNYVALDSGMPFHLFVVGVHLKQH